MMTALKVPSSQCVLLAPYRLYAALLRSLPALNPACLNRVYFVTFVHFRGYFVFIPGAAGFCKRTALPTPLAGGGEGLLDHLAALAGALPALLHFFAERAQGIEV